MPCACPYRYNCLLFNLYGDIYDTLFILEHYLLYVTKQDIVNKEGRLDMWLVLELCNTTKSKRYHVKIKMFANIVFIVPIRCRCNRRQANMSSSIGLVLFIWSIVRSKSQNPYVYRKWLFRDCCVWIAQNGMKL